MYLFLVFKSRRLTAASNRHKTAKKTKKKPRQYENETGVCNYQGRIHKMLYESIIYAYSIQFTVLQICMYILKGH